MENNPNFEQHAKALGYLCLEWSALEGLINLILASLVPLPEKEVSDCVTNNADVRDKIQMVLSIGFLKRPSDKWFKDLKAHLDTIDIRLRPERNRMIHDDWIVSEEEVLKRTRKTFLIKPQAHQMSLLTYKEIPVTSEGILGLVEAVKDETFHLLHLWLAYSAHVKPEMLEGHDTEFQQFLLSKI